jgi:hypothetical protein
MRILALAIGGVLLTGCGVTEPTTATITFCPGQVIGGTIAVRDDANNFGLPGRWTTVDAPDGKTFSFAVPRRLTIAFTETETSNASHLRMFQLTSAELSRLDCLTTSGASARIYTGTIAGLATGRVAQVGLGTGLISRGNGSYTMQNLAQGASDLVALMRVGTSVEKFIVRRDLDLQSGSVISPIDFAGSEPVAPRVNKATVSGAGAGGIATLYRLITNGTNVGIAVPQSSGVLTLASLPAENQKDGDFYVVGASTRTGGVNVQRRSVVVRFGTPQDRVLSLGPSLQVPTTAFTAATGPSSIRVTLPVQSEYGDRVDVTLNQFTDGNFLGVTMTMTRAYRGEASEWNFETPAPLALTSRSVKFDPGASTTWLVYATSGDFTSPFTGVSSPEITVREAYLDGAVSGGPIYHSLINNSHPERLCRLCSRTFPF